METEAHGNLTAALSGAAVAMRGITKRFPGVVANDGVDFEAAVGEVHALLGENGAGKSTLSNILTGLYRADEGELVVYGEPVEFASPREALEAGIGMVHQHFRLVAAVHGRRERRPRRPPRRRVGRSSSATPRSTGGSSSWASATACASTPTRRSGSSRWASSNGSRS